MRTRHTQNMICLAIWLSCYYKILDHLFSIHQVIPLEEYSDRITMPTPDPSPLPERVRSSDRHVRSVSRRVYPRMPPRMPSDLSLSTISEEPTQYSSHEIVVEPQVVVETSLPGQPGAHPAVSSSTRDSRESSNSNVSTLQGGI